MDGSGNVTAVNTFGAGGLVSRHVAAGSTFYTFDTQGSTVERLDSSQNVLSTDVFDAFGKLLSGTASDPWGYEAQDGYVTDIETGLISLSFRYYDPVQGRFLNRDPIGFDGGINLYGYVGNGPLALTDPAGTDGIIGRFIGWVGSIPGRIGGWFNGLFRPKLQPGTPTFGSASQHPELAPLMDAPDLAQGIQNEYGRLPAAGQGVNDVLNNATGSVIMAGGSEIPLEDLADLGLTRTVANKCWERPYVNSAIVPQEIMRAGEPIPDPGGVPGGLRWDVPGAYNGSEGSWGLVVDLAKRQIIHFQFTSSKTVR